MTMLDTSFNDITHPQVVRGRGSPSDGDLAANAVFIPELERRHDKGVHSGRRLDE